MGVTELSPPMRHANGERWDEAADNNVPDDAASDVTTVESCADNICDQLMKVSVDLLAVARQKFTAATN